jgi:hypothetical protein
MQAATIKLFLLNGEATGVRTAEILNWTGRALAGPRTEIAALLKREELDRPGVYILLGVDDSGEQRVYVGEAECVKNRLLQHKSKEFWVQVIVFTSKDENLTKAHIKYLEGELIKKAHAVGKARLENGQESGSSLPESDLADMKVFLSKLYQLLPVLGTDVFSAAVRKKLTAGNMLYCRKQGVEASGQRSSNGFLILKGSHAFRTETQSIPENISKARASLAEKGVLVASGETFVFSCDYECTSPSFAASLVRGGSSNGLIEWKNKAGKSLKEIEG